MKGLEAKQKMLNIPQHQLIQSCATRWNSVCDMLERLFEQCLAITASLNDHSITKVADECKLMLQERRWQLMEDIIVVANLNVLPLSSVGKQM